MGIRFHCSNGHRLNVKSFLAGRRGICPECGERVQIPDAADQLAAANPGDSHAVVAAAESVSAVLQKPAAENPVRPTRRVRTKVERDQLSKEKPRQHDSDSIEIPIDEPPAAGDGKPASVAARKNESKSCENAVWYVRPPAGGQFGPADNETFSRWILEKRVIPDSFVWCEGWTDWQQARNVAELLPVPLTANRPSVVENQAGAAAPDDINGQSSEVVDSLKRSRRRSTRNQIIVATLLAIAVVGLLLVLAWVLLYDPPPESNRGGVVQRNMEILEFARGEVRLT